MGSMAVSPRPPRAPTLLLGVPGGVRVWGVHDDDPNFLAGVAIGRGRPTVRINLATRGTDLRWQALCWAFDRLADSDAGLADSDGYFELKATPAPLAGR